MSNKRLQYKQLWHILRKAEWDVRHDDITGTSTSTEAIIRYRRACSVFHPSVVSAVEYSATSNHDILAVPFRYRTKFVHSGGLIRVSTLYLQSLEYKQYRYSERESDYQLVVAWDRILEKWVVDINIPF